MIVRVLLALLVAATARAQFNTSRYGFPLSSDQLLNNDLRMIDQQINRGHSLHPAGSGDIQFGNDDTICFRNATNTADCCLNMGGTNQLSFSGGCTIAGAGGGVSTFDQLGSGTNVTATMTCGTGCVMQPSGSGAIVASQLAGPITGCAANQAFTQINLLGNSQNCFQPALITPTPVATQLAVWADATHVQGFNNLTFTNATPTLVVGQPGVQDGLITSACTAASGTCKADFPDNAAPCPAPTSGFTRACSTAGRLGQIVNGGVWSAFLFASSIDTLTNKTFNTAGIGNHLSINGRDVTALTGNTGTLATGSGVYVNGNCIRADAGGNLIDAGTTCGGGSTPRLDQVLDPNVNKAFTMGANTLTMTWGNATGASTDLHVLVDTASNTGTGHVLSVQTAASSSAKPLLVTAHGTANGVEMDTGGVLNPIGSGRIAARWSDLVNPGGVQALSMGTNSTSWTFSGSAHFTVQGSAATGATPVMIVADSTSNTGTAPIFSVSTGGASTAPVVVFTAQGGSNGVQMDTTGSLAPIGTGKLAPRLNDVTNPTASTVISDAFGMQMTLTSGSSGSWLWSIQGANTGSQDKFIVEDFNGNTGTGVVLRADTVGTSTMNPWQATAKGLSNGVQVDSTATLHAIGTGKIDLTVANVTSTGNTANISATNLVASATAGQYRFCCTEKITTAAGTSSTLPTCRMTYTDVTDSVTVTFSPTGSSNGNTVGTIVSGCALIDAANATAIQYSTSNYASSPAGMTYKVTIALDRVH